MDKEKIAYTQSQENPRIDLQKILDSKQFTIENWNEYLNFEEGFAVLDILFYENLIIFIGEYYDKDDSEYYCPRDVYIYDPKKRKVIKSAKEMGALSIYDGFFGFLYTDIYRNHLILQSEKGGPIIVYDLDTNKVISEITDFLVDFNSYNTESNLLDNQHPNTERIRLIGSYDNFLIISNEQTIVVYDLDSKKIVFTIGNLNIDYILDVKLSNNYLIIHIDNKNDLTDSKILIYDIKLQTSHALKDPALISKLRYVTDVYDNYLICKAQRIGKINIYDLAKGEIIKSQDMGLKTLDVVKGTYIYNNQLVLIGNFGFLIYNLVEKKVIISPEDSRNIPTLSRGHYLTHISTYKNYIIFAGYEIVMIYDLNKQKVIKSPTAMQKILKLKSYSFSSIHFNGEYIIFCDDSGSVTTLKLNG